jgi:hypothetical protein
MHASGYFGLKEFKKNEGIFKWGENSFFFSSKIFFNPKETFMIKRFS